MEYFNHYTLNTGHNRQSYASEVSSSTVFIMKTMVKRIVEAGGICEFFLPETFMEITLEDDIYAATLYIEDGQQNKQPILLSLATTNPKKRKEMIGEVNDVQKAFGINRICIIPKAPVIVDILLPAIHLRPELAHLTGDLTRCLAWVLLSPESVLVKKEEDEHANA